MLNAVSRFKQLSEDFLKLVNHKAKQASKSSYAASELSVMQGFYNGLESLLTNVDNEYDHLKVQRNYWQTMSDVLKQELESCNRDNVKVAERPSRKQLWQIKERYAKGGVTISQICDHFYVTDDEIKEIMNGQKEVVKQAKTG